MIKYDKIEISDEFFIFSKNNLYGIMNCDGRIILDEFYTAISSYDYSYDTKLFKITNEGYVGIWDAINKELILPCEYDEIDRIDGISSKYHKISQNNKKGLIDYTGKQILATIYDDIFDYSLWNRNHSEYNKTEFLVIRNDKYGIVDINDSSVLPNIYDSILRVVFGGHTEHYTEEVYNDYTEEPSYLEHSEFISEIYYQRGRDNNVYFYTDKDANYDETKYVESIDSFYFICKKDDKVGVLDKTQNIIIPFEYNDIDIAKIDIINENSYEDRDYFVTCYVHNINGWGIRNQQTEIFPCSVEKITRSSNYYIIEQNKKLGIISLEGESISDCIYDKIEFSVNNVREVYIGEKCGCINQKGNILIPCEFDSIKLNSYSKPRFAIVSNEELEGVWCLNPFTKKWESYIPCSYDKVSDKDSSERNALKGLKNKDSAIYTLPFMVAKKDKWGLMVLNNDGANLLIPIKYDEIYTENERNYFVGYKTIIGGKQGFVSSRGTDKIECIYDNIIISKGNIITEKDSKYGLFTICNKGIMNVLECKYDEINGKVFRHKNKYGKWDFVNKIPKIIVEPIYDNIENHILKLNGKYGFIDIVENEPKIILPCEFDAIIVHNIMQELHESDYEGGEFTYYNDTGIPHIIIAEKNGKKGLWKKENNTWVQKLPYQYDIINSNEIQKEGKVGLMQNWNIIIPCEYDKIECIIEEYKNVYYTKKRYNYIVINNDKKGFYFNKKGAYSLVIPCICDDIAKERNAPSGTYKYKVGVKNGLWSESFELEPIFDSIQFISNEYILASNYNYNYLYKYDEGNIKLISEGFISLNKGYLIFHDHILQYETGIESELYDSIRFLCTCETYSTTYYESKPKYSLTDSIPSDYNTKIIALVFTKCNKFGILDSNLSLIKPNTYDSIEIYSKETGILQLRRNSLLGLWGKRTENKEINVDCEYDSIDDFAESQFSLPEFQVHKNKKIGLLNCYGKIVLDCIYDKIETINSISKYYIGWIDDKCGLYSSEGNELLKPEYDKFEIDNNQVIVRKDEKYGLFELPQSNHKIVKLLDCRFDTIQSVRDYQIVSQNGKYGLYGFVNANDSEERQYQNLFEVEYDSISFKDYRVLATKNNKTGLYWANHTEIIPPKHEQLYFATTTEHSEMFGGLKNETEYFFGIDDNKYVIIGYKRSDFLNIELISDTSPLNTLSLDQIDTSDSTLIKVRKDGIWGTLRISGNYLVIETDLENEDGKKGLMLNFKRVLDVIYDKIEFQSNRYNIYYKKQMAFLAIKDGNTFLSHFYDSIIQIKDQYRLYAVQANSCKGIINDIGKIILPCICTKYEIHGSSVIYTNKNGKKGIVSTNGQNIVDDTCDDAKQEISISFQDNGNGLKSASIISIKQNDKVGLVCNNKLVIPMLYDNVFSDKTSSGFYNLEFNGKFGLYSVEYAKIILECKYDEILSTKTGFKIKKSQKVGFVDKDGNLILNCEYDDMVVIEDWSSPNVYLICKNNKWGTYIDKNISIPIEYQDIKPIGKSNFAIKSNEKWGLISNNNQLLIPCEYDDIYEKNEQKESCYSFEPKLNAIYYITVSNGMLGAYDSDYKRICDCKFKSIEFAGWEPPIIHAFDGEREKSFVIPILEITKE